MSNLFCSVILPSYPSNPSSVLLSSFFSVTMSFCHLSQSCIASVRQSSKGSRRLRPHDTSACASGLQDQQRCSHSLVGISGVRNQRCLSKFQRCGATSVVAVRTVPWMHLRERTRCRHSRSRRIRGVAGWSLSRYLCCEVLDGSRRIVVG